MDSLEKERASTRLIIPLALKVPIPAIVIAFNKHEHPNEQHAFKNAYMGWNLKRHSKHRPPMSSIALQALTSKTLKIRKHNIIQDSYPICRNLQALSFEKKNNSPIQADANICTRAFDCEKSTLNPLHSNVGARLMESNCESTGLRPILIGSGAVARPIWGTWVIGGLLAASLIANFLIAVTFCVIEKWAGAKDKDASLPDAKPERQS